MNARLAVAEALEVAIADVPDDASIDTFEKWDSLGHMRIIVFLEEVVGRPLETEEVVGITDLASIENLLSNRR